MKAPESTDEPQTQTEFSRISVWVECLSQHTFVNENIIFNSTVSPGHQQELSPNV